MLSFTQIRTPVFTTLGVVLLLLGLGGYLLEQNVQVAVFISTLLVLAGIDFLVGALWTGRYALVRAAAVFDPVSRRLPVPVPIPKPGAAE
jgi:hypothetical protein